MKFLVIFAAALLCVQAVQLPYLIYSEPDTSSLDSSEETNNPLPSTSSQRPPGLPGINVINRPDSSESNEDEYRILLPTNGERLASLPGIGVVNQPVFQAVKVKVPRYGNALIRQHLLAQALAARGINPQYLSPQPLTRRPTNVEQNQVLLIRAQRQAPVTPAVDEGISETTTVAGDVVTDVPVAAPVVSTVPIGSKST
ncbi:uncharacterized protein LOC128862062 [Anastrepha ludens]|uniref:uncharacterized protein LOC128862062 n=1 Tax=Anastrepha ludens TaxID=28586 RepID=UPI0023B0657C|nr:uncharacterized protein LOC128862062 [Anastrepha ludens]